PLAGIRAGLAAARNRWVLLLPCDTPLIDRPLLQSLYSTAIETPDRPLMLRSGDQREPLFSIIPTSLRGQIEACWHRGERSPQRVLLQLGAAELQIQPGDPRLANLNTPELLEMARASTGTSC
ncbi:MAG: molybdenum cofactor guanylyltransferase MobA, partial [Gammaproteobacteria bacterium HGW-Gammaproteobacteria-9]